MGKKISSYKLQQKVLKLFLNFPPNGPHKTTLGIFDILSLRFFISKISNSLILHPLEKPKTSIIWKTSDRTAKWNEIWDLREV